MDNESQLQQNGIVFSNEVIDRRLLSILNAPFLKLLSIKARLVEFGLLFCYVIPRIKRVEPMQYDSLNTLTTSVQLSHLNHSLNVSFNLISFCVSLLVDWCTDR